MEEMRGLFPLLSLVVLTTCALPKQGYFNVENGYSVATTYASTSATSLLQCSYACHAENDFTPATCAAASYNDVTRQCRLSNQTEISLDAASEAVVLSQVCGLPPVLAKASLVQTSDFTADVVCQRGLIPTLPTVECLPGSGWNTSGVDCVPAPPTMYYGTSYVTGFMQNGVANYGIPTLLISCPASTALVNISIPELSIFNEQHTVTDGALTLTYNYTISAATSGEIARKGAHVTADRPIMLFAGSIKTSGSSDGSLVFPETSLGTDYIISGHPSTRSGTDEFLIIGTMDNTSITMNIKSVTESITLNRMETYMRAGADLSGTMISSSAPVYVLSGHSCATIPDNSVLYCDYIDEAMTPITSLGTVHVISYMQPRPDFTISIATPYNDTSVTIYSAAGSVLEAISSMMQTSVIFRTYTGSKSISVVASQPVLVTQYSHGSGNTGGDPSMMTIPDVNHFGHQYDFVVPNGFRDANTVVLVMNTNFSSNGLLLDGDALTPTQILSVTIPGYGNYVILYGSVTVGYHNLAHTADTGVSFGGWLFGYSSNQQYAWSLGYV